VSARKKTGEERRTKKGPGHPSGKRGLRESSQTKKTRKREMKETNINEIPGWDMDRCVKRLRAKPGRKEEERKEKKILPPRKEGRTKTRRKKGAWNTSAKRSRTNNERERASSPDEVTKPQASKQARRHERTGKKGDAR